MKNRSNSQEKNRRDNIKTNSLTSQQNYQVVEQKKFEKFTWQHTLLCFHFQYLSYMLFYSNFKQIE